MSDKKDEAKISKFDFIKRISIDALMLLGVFLIAFFAPDVILPATAKLGLISIFFSKLVFVSAGIIHAHISRKIIFPYINFALEKDWSNNLLIIAWYVTIIFAWARGG